MSRIFAINKILLFALLAGMTSTAFAQSDDFTTWTKFKVNYKIDPRFSLLSNLEFRTKDDVGRMGPFGIDHWRRVSGLFIFEAGSRI